jgi:uncharacterized membrane protein YfcA
MGAVVLAASYVQASAGFSFSIFVVAIASGFSLMPLWHLTELVSALVVCNAAVAIKASRHRPDPRMIAPILAGLLPAVGVGVWILSAIRNQHVNWALMMLGAVTVAAALSLITRPTRAAYGASIRNRFLTGVTAGLLGGTLAAPGPPLVMSLYREPVAVAQVRVSLLTILLIFGATRLVAAQAASPSIAESLLLIAIYGPASMLGALIGARLPPPLSEQSLRRSVFAILLLVGSMLFVDGLSGQW